MTDVVFAVGNDMRGDDGAGPLLAQLLETQPASGWEVVDGGSAPENCLHHVRASSPGRVLLVDAADMGLPPGEIRRLDEGCIADHLLMTTHAIPLNFLIASLKETVPEIVFLGIQPKDIAFLSPMTEAVRQSVEDLHRKLVAGEAIENFPAIGD